MDWTNLLQMEASQLGAWSYLLLAILVAVEGPAVTLLGAAAATSSTLRLPLVFVAASAGNLVADFLWYTLGYTGHIKTVYRLGRWLGIRPDQIQTVEHQLQRNAVKVLLVAKLTAGLVIPSLVAAGLIKVPWRKWFPIVLVAEMLWTGTLVILGYYATAWLAQIERGLQVLTLGGSIFIVLLIIYLVRRRRRSHKGVAPSDR